MHIVRVGEEKETSRGWRERKEIRVSRRVLGEFEHQILLAILRRGLESYSVEIVMELERRTGRQVATSAVFIALNRLQRRGLLKDRLAEAGEEGAHRRRYFRLTPLAMEMLRESRRAYLSLWEGCQALLDDGGGRR